MKRSRRPRCGAVRPPPRWLWALELPRGAWGLASMIAAKGIFADVPRGDGRSVLLLPGLVNTDRSNIMLQRSLVALGYRAQGWGLGRNLGTRAIGPEGERLIARIRALHDETGEKVTLIGVSLGGIMARYAAHIAPELVREVITISAPFAGDPRATNVWRAFQLLTGERIDAPRVVAQSALVAKPLPVPATALWSRSDGLVAGAICHDANGPAIEIRSSHIGVQLRPEVLRTVALILAGQPPGQSRPVSPAR